LLNHSSRLENAAQAVDNALGQGPTPAFAAATVNGGVSSVTMDAASMTGITSTAAHATTTISRANFWVKRITELDPVYKKFANWDEIKTSFLGKTASETTLPPGYRYAKINGVEYAYLEAANPKKVPLIKTSSISNGEWDVPKSLPSSPYRIADGARYAAAYGTKVLDLGSQIHHLIADNIWRSVDVFQEAMRRGIAHMDVRGNLVELAESQADLARARAIDSKFPEILHKSQHPEFDAFVSRRVQSELDLIKATTGRPVKKWSDSEITNFIKRMQGETRDLILNSPSTLPKKPNGTLGFIPKSPDFKET
jgi:hypothetical protein